MLPISDQGTFYGDVMFQEFSVIFDLADEDHLIAVARYVFGIYKRLPQKVREILEIVG